MKILVIDDKPEQLKRAMEAVEAAGYDCEVAQSLSEARKFIESADGILTDLEFNPFTGDSKLYNAYSVNPPPAGLLVVIMAMQFKKPVAICTDGEHHGEKLSWLFDGYWAALACGQVDDNDPLPTFGWNDRKDWANALEQLNL